MTNDRSHLTAKKITDKNGRQTTVHVNDRKSDGQVNAEKLGGISASAQIGSKSKVNNWSMDELTSEEQTEVLERVMEHSVDDVKRTINDTLIEEIAPSEGMDDADIDQTLRDPVRLGVAYNYAETEEGYQLREAQRSTTERVLLDKIEEKSKELKALDEDDDDRIPGDFHFDTEGVADDDYLADVSERIDKDEHDTAYAQKRIDLSKPRGFEYDAGLVSKEQIAVGDDRQIAKEVLPDDATEEEIEAVSKSVRDLVNSEMVGDKSVKINLLWNGKPSDVIKPNEVPSFVSPSNENKRATWRVESNGFSHYAPYPVERMEMMTFSGDNPMMKVSDDIMVMTTDENEGE